MVQIEERYRGVRDRQISSNLRSLLERAASEAGIDRIVIFSGGQPGSTGRSTGSKRHNNGNAGDMNLFVGGSVLRFTDTTAPESIRRFVAAAAKLGATGIGAGVGYMGPTSLHVGFGLPRTVWGAKGLRRNAPTWLIEAFKSGMETALVGVEEYAVVARTGARLKSGPGVRFDAIEVVPVDTPVSVLALDGINKEWARVDLVGDGYVDGHIHISSLRAKTISMTAVDGEQDCCEGHLPDDELDATERDSVPD